MKIYKSLKNVDGSYSHMDFIRRGLQLVGLREFNKFYKKYHNSINGGGGGKTINISRLLCMSSAIRCDSL